MVYQLQYNICAVLIYITVLVTHISRKKTKERHHYYFMVMVITSLIGCIMNIGNTYGHMHMGVMSSWMLAILDYVFFVSQGLIMFEFAVYSVTLTKNSISHIRMKLRLALYIPILFYIVVLISNPYTKAIFYYKDDTYCRGEQQLLVYGLAFYYVTFGILYVLREKKSTSKQLKFALACYCITGLFASFIQYLNPELLTHHIGFSICELIILLNLQKTEEFLESELNVYNKIAFERLFRLNNNSNLSMRLLMINMEDLDFLMQSVGIDREKGILRNVAKFLDQVSGENTYYMENSTFYVVVDGGEEKPAELIKKIETRFEKKWSNGIEEVAINYKMLLISIPEDVKTLDELYFCNANFMESTARNGHIIEIKDVDFDKIGRRMKVEQLIKKAIAEDNFQIYYQPIYSTKEKRITSAEALIRLIDPEEGFVSPAEFIPIAEKNGSIIKIGEMVFEKVFQFIKRSNICKLGIEYIEINLSVVQCMQKGLAKRVIQLIDSHGIDKKNINLEITETAAADSPKTLMENMLELSNAEITFSLDDFGTGYSNISSLMSMPLDIIKFDKSMIDMVDTHEHGKNVIDSSVAMVKGMGLKIVAEGIEQEEQLKMLQDMGVDYIQGYYFSKPLPENEFIAYLEKYYKEN